MLRAAAFAPRLLTAARTRATGASTVLSAGLASDPGCDGTQSTVTLPFYKPELSGTLVEAAQQTDWAYDIGQTCHTHRRFGAAEVAAFGEVSGDRNPLHLDADYAAKTPFGRPIVHGMLYGSMFSTMIASTIPGGIYLSQTFKFKAPLFVGELLFAHIEVTRLLPRAGALFCEVTAHRVEDNGEHTLLMTGEAGCMVKDQAHTAKLARELRAMEEA
eukprot:PLAT9860.1.p1 GENE.PLAT9860.1~~PLAT9860.1.p1  ORF type:complete len:233 (-),score=98.53 PLAT9860.1:42-689(-)